MSHLQHHHFLPTKTNFEPQVHHLFCKDIPVVLCYICKYIALLFHMSGFFMLYVGDILVSGFKHCLFSISYMGSSETHWRSPSFFKMVSLPPTSVSNATSFPCHTTSCFFRKSSQCFHRPRRCRTSTSVTAHRRIASRWAMGHGPRLPAGRLQKGVTSGKSQDFGASNHIKYL